MDFVDLFVKSKLIEMSPVTVLSLSILILGRLLPVISLAPFFGARVLPHPVKLVLGLCLLTMVLPRVINSLSGP
jgi:type III secretion protein T